MITNRGKPASDHFRIAYNPPRTPSFTSQNAVLARERLFSEYESRTYLVQRVQHGIVKVSVRNVAHHLTSPIDSNVIAFGVMVTPERAKQVLFVIANPFLQKLFQLLGPDRNERDIIFKLPVLNLWFTKH